MRPIDLAGRGRIAVDVQSLNRRVLPLQLKQNRERADKAVDTSLADQFNLSRAVAGNDDLDVAAFDPGTPGDQIHIGLGCAAERENADGLTSKVFAFADGSVLEAHQHERRALVDGRNRHKRCALGGDGAHVIHARAHAELGLAGNHLRQLAP